MNEVFEWREAPAGEFAVIGNPVAHSLSPRMHAAIYRYLGLDYQYRAIRVPEGEVSAALDRLKDLGYRGINVTVPHKEEILSWCTDVEPFAATVKAANTIDLQSKKCINTDAPGFLDTLEDLSLKGREVLMLGAGGSARALVAALCENGYRVRIYNRTAAKAEELAVRWGGVAISSADPLGVDLILNGTSSAFDLEAPPVIWENVKPEAVAYDLMYARDLTPFLREAFENHLQIVDGLPLLVAQGARSFEWWTGLEAPRDVMAEAILFR